MIICGSSYVLHAAEENGVVDVVLRFLDPVGQPSHDVVGVVAANGDKIASGNP
jgi:hypothetical protein